MGFVRATGGGFNNGGVTAWLGERQVRCLVCEGVQFRSRETKLNSTGAEFFNMGWANESALGLICLACGYVHEFAGRALQLRQAA
ncbi:hypothetical protein D5S17_04320 [Pseudonocardiaceae bacterium YIM PH 21723]|nr:hypothetical protein D5S17_04320 [Pseudonocardiaceae bacterium YIM PH 21723]